MQILDDAASETEPTDLCTLFHTSSQASAVINACGKIESRALRDVIRTKGRRQDGRTTSMIRPIACEAGILPRTHGSSLFTRGETQAIGVATLGGSQDAQRQDDVEAGEDKRFMLHYFFPPSSVGETGRTGGASRREIGHGNLAERALMPILPSEEDFPFVCKLESTITESNGSSSMATVCAGTLALLDAGVPIKRCGFGDIVVAEIFFEKARSLRTLFVAPLLWCMERDRVITWRHSDASRRVLRRLFAAALAVEPWNGRFFNCPALYSNAARKFVSRVALALSVTDLFLYFQFAGKSRVSPWA